MRVVASDLQKLCQGLRNRRDGFKLTAKDWESEEWSEFVGLLANEFTTLVDLDFHRFNLTDERVADLVEALPKGAASIKRFGLSPKYLTEGGLASLAKIFAFCPNLEQVRVAENDHVDDHSIEKLCKAIGNHSNLRHFLANDTDLSAQGAQSVVEWAITLPKLSKLSLRNCKIGDNGAQWIKKWLESNPAAEELIISNADIGDAGAIAIAEGLSKCQSLATIDLFGNPISNKGIRALCHAINETSCIRTVDLGAITDLDLKVMDLLGRTVQSVNDRT